MRRAFLAALPALLALSACAPRPGVDRDPRAPTEVLRGGAILMDNAPESADALLAAPVDRVWAALFDAYEALGIEITHLDARRHVLGNQQVEIRRQLADVPASEYFDCGRTVTGMPAADRYRIRASITTQAMAAGRDSTLLVTSVGAVGRAMAGTSTGEVRCATRGGLEIRIAQLVAYAIATDGTAIK